MTIATEWAARLSATRQKQLTNPDDVAASTVDTTRRDAAIADVTAAFASRAQITVDETDDEHIRVAVMGVSAYLESYGSKSAATATAALEAFHVELDRLAQAGPRKRITPKTSSVLTPRAPESGSEPLFGRSRFTDIQVDAPDSSEDS